VIKPARLKTLTDAPVRSEGRYVLYWMQAAQRAHGNAALEYAIAQANELDLPVLVAFGLTGFPEANARHYDFMLRGLAEAKRLLTRRGIAFVLKKQPPEALIRTLAADAALVVCDRGYLKVQRTWRAKLADGLDRRLVQVEGEVVVPIDVASAKHEYAARTIRPRIHRVWDEYLRPPEEVAVRRPATELAFESDFDLDRPEAIVAGLKVDQAVGAVKRFPAGETAARAQLERFLRQHLARYGDERGKPEAGVASLMSPYLHFGQIGPLEVALAVRDSCVSEGVATYLEELIVRRELAINHVFHATNYDSYEVLPDWARRTLADHAGDERPYLYSRAQFEAGATHDPYWNAAMLEMRATGYMHNHMRMYWGKKILQWSTGPEEAFETALGLNNRWFLDGRDPNSFTNVGWLFGLHDRPWGPQPVFGTVRSMGANTFKKFDAPAYVREVERLAAAEGDQTR
jgi:deoxyribodipyrimidine photo-lyase